MCKSQLYLDFDYPLVEKIASRFTERQIYKMAYKGWISEVVQIKAIKHQKINLREGK